jgi:GR25 family glycosyltransferase involved in LPS biosynthesis
MLYKNAINSKKKYTVIFEDDFEIVTDDLNKKILEITKNLDDNFDLVYLGNLYESRSTKVKNDIYKKSTIIPLLGFHAILLNNKNAKKIYDYLKNINDTVDKNLEKLINENKINNYVIYPSLVNQNNNFESTLRPYYEIIRRQIVQEMINIYNKLFD